MKLIEQIKAKLASIGGLLDPVCNYTLNLDAPKGYVWCANGTPTLSIHWANNTQTWLCEAVRAETPNLKMGLRLATDDELVEIRWNNDDDSWVAPKGSPERIEWPAGNESLCSTYDDFITDLNDSTIPRLAQAASLGISERQSTTPKR